MEFVHQITFADKFSKKPKLGFRVHPVKYGVAPDDTYNFIQCTPEEATHYALYCLVQDGDLVIEEWIADLETPEAAEQLRGLLCTLCGMDNCRLLTVALLEQMQPGEVIGTGVTVNARIHAGLLRWVAVRGGGMPDWTIYYHMQEMSVDFIKQHGEKLITESIIRGLIPCDQGAWNLYRK